MLSSLLRRLASRAAADPPAPTSPETLYLDDAPGLRTILPHLQGTYAALVNSEYGLVIINRNDAGVGWQLATRGSYDAEQMRLLGNLASAAPAGAVVLDIGANIGITSLIIARAVGPAGLVHAYEPQRPLFHMLAGNLALNGIDNVHCHWMAVGRAPGEARLPRIDYHAHTSFGSIELNRERQSDAGQQAVGGEFDTVTLTSIDALDLRRVDLIKIDVEGMEADVLAGGSATIAACKPLMYVEYLKSGKQALGQALGDAGYAIYDAGDNFVCIPQGDSRLITLTAELQLQRWSVA
jgi:FkbM family methyltransferase